MNGIVIFSNGSKFDTEWLGFGLRTPTFSTNFKLRLPDYCSIFPVKLIAIMVAARIVATISGYKPINNHTFQCNTVEV